MTVKDVSGIKDIAIPKLVVTVAGVFMVISYFLADKNISNLGTDLSVTATVVSYFALAVGVFSLALFHINKVIRRQENWPFSVWLLFVLFGILILGLTSGVNSDLYNLLYNSIESPLLATTYGLLGFYIASASFRVFRIRTIDSVVFLIGTVGVMLKNAPIGGVLSPILPEIGDFLFTQVNSSVNRAILMGIATGSFLLFFRILRGRETRYLGTD